MKTTIHQIGPQYVNANRLLEVLFDEDSRLREAVIRCEWQDLEVADPAVVLQTTPKAVESRLYRARTRLREQLSRWL